MMLRNVFDEHCRCVIFAFFYVTVINHYIEIVKHFQSTVLFFFPLMMLFLALVAKKAQL